MALDLAMDSGVPKAEEQCSSWLLEGIFLSYLPVLHSSASEPPFIWLKPETSLLSRHAQCRALRCGPTCVLLGTASAWQSPSSFRVYFPAGSMRHWACGSHWAACPVTWTVALLILQWFPFHFPDPRASDRHSRDGPVQPGSVESEKRFQVHFIWLFGIPVHHAFSSWSGFRQTSVNLISVLKLWAYLPLGNETLKESFILPLASQEMPDFSPCIAFVQILRVLHWVPGPCPACLGQWLPYLGAGVAPAPAPALTGPGWLLHSAVRPGSWKEAAAFIFKFKKCFY